MYKTAGKAELYNQEEITQMQQLLDGIEKERIIQTIYQLSEVENEMKWSTQRTILFQVGIIKVATKQEQGDLSGLQARIQDLENKIVNLQRTELLSTKSKKMWKTELQNQFPKEKESQKPTTELKALALGAMSLTN